MWYLGLLLLLPTVNAQETTFQDCYSDTYNKINIDNPEIKQFLTNFCNFFHEKTGVWITDDYDTNTMNPQLINEFFTTYGIPDSLSQLIINLAFS